MTRILYTLMFAAILCVYGPVFAQTTATIGATFTTAPRFIQCVDYVCRDDTGEIVGTLEQIEPGVGGEETTTEKEEDRD